MNMKPNMNRKGLYALVCALMGLTFGMLTSCSDDLDVQQSYPFTVETMPVPTRIVKGETVEIRCELKREGRFSDARYTIRYFQPDGKGKLRMDDGMCCCPTTVILWTGRCSAFITPQSVRTSRALTSILRTTASRHSFFS